MTITAKFDGHCRVCGGEIRAGERIEWTRGQGSQHLTCPERAPVEEPELVVRPDESTRLGRMLAAGGARVTFVFDAKPGQTVREHRTYDLRVMRRNESWDRVDWDDCTHVFVTYGSWPDRVRVATIRPRNRGEAMMGWADSAGDDDRLALRKIMRAAVSGEVPDEVREESRCGMCGKPLSDPVSIARGLGPDCAGKFTKSRARKVACA